MKSKITTYLAAIPPVVVIFYIFFNYAPWFLASEPIENIKNYDLTNMPPPEGVISFAVNHGEAIYYYEKTQLELISASVALILSTLLLAFLLTKSAKNET